MFKILIEMSLIYIKVQIMSNLYAYLICFSNLYKKNIIMFKLYYYLYVYVLFSKC